MKRLEISHLTAAIWLITNNISVKCQTTNYGVILAVSRVVNAPLKCPNREIFKAASLLGGRKGKKAEEEGKDVVGRGKMIKTAYQLCTELRPCSWDDVAIGKHRNAL